MWRAGFSRGGWLVGGGGDFNDRLLFSLLFSWNFLGDQVVMEDDKVVIGLGSPTLGKPWRVILFTEILVYRFSGVSPRGFRGANMVNQLSNNLHINSTIKSRWKVSLSILSPYCLQFPVLMAQLDSRLSHQTISTVWQNWWYHMTCHVKR